MSAMKLIPKHLNGLHIVKSGDTFSGIAKKYGTTLQTLEQLNPLIKNIDRLSIGDTVYYLPLNKITLAKTIDGIKVPLNTTSSVDLTPVNMDKFNTIVNHNGALLKVDNGLLTNLDNYLISKNVGLPQRQAILYSVVQEGSTTGDHGNGAYGYLGWRGARIPGKGVDLMLYLYDTVFGIFNANHWNNGGVGSGYKTGKAAQQSFINAKTVQDALRALNYGYVRPDLSISKFRSANGASYFLTGGPIKKIARTINLHGNKQTYKLYSFDDFKKYYFRTRKYASENPLYPSDKLNWTILAEKRARQLYLEQYGESYPFFPGAEKLKNYTKIFDKVLKEYYDLYLKNNPVPNTTNSLTAAKLSILGNGMAVIPHPITRIPGTLLMIPDYVYDLALAVDEPKPSNIAHNVVDYAPYLGKLIPGSYDDLLLYGLNLIGNADDAVSANGNDVFNFLNPKPSVNNSRETNEPVNKGNRTDR